MSARSDHARELARTFMQFAVELYQEDGYLQPVIIFHDAEGHGLICGPGKELSSNNHPGEAAAMLVMLLARTLEAEYMIFIVETWVRATTEEEEAAHPTVHGDLAAQADTDPHIKTNLMVMVLCPKAWEDSYVCNMILGAFEAEGGVGIGLEPLEQAGFPEGEVPDMLRRAYQESPATERPPLEIMASVLVEKKVCTSAVVV